MNLGISYLQSLQNFYNSKAPEGFVYVKGISFEGIKNLFPKSNVSIEARKIHIDDFYMCDHPVTQAEFKAIFPEGYTPFFKKDAAEGEVQENRPADSVGWYNAIAYCNKRSVLEGLTPCYTIPGVTDVEGFSWENFPYSSIPFGIHDDAWDGTLYNPSANGYRLPTEIEWVYAARGGVFCEDSIYSGSDDINEVAWHTGNSSGKTHEVKKKAPNKLGLYDMSGNVWEWCWNNDSKYILDTRNVAGIHRVLRGGCWGGFVAYCGVSYHRYSDSYNCLGFRVVRSSSN